MDEIYSQRPPYNARNVMEFRIPSAPNVYNDVVLDFTAAPSTNKADYGNKSCIDETNKIIYIDMPPHVIDTAMVFKVILGIGARCEPSNFSTMNLDSINYLTVFAESGVSSKYKIVRLKKYKYTDCQIFTASIPNVISKITGSPVKTSFMIGSNTGVWGKPFDAVIYLPSTADSSKLKISLSLNNLTSYKAKIFGPCSPAGPVGSTLTDKNNNLLFDTDGPLYDSTLVYSTYKVPVTYDSETGDGLTFTDGILFRSFSYSETTRKYYRLRIVKSKSFDSTLVYIDPSKMALMKNRIIKKK
jgi:hypothetical protein